MSTADATAVLLSGGLDSALLIVEEADVAEVQPIYVSAGLAWERAERSIIDRFLAAVVTRHRVRSLVALSLDMTEVYAKTHWAIEGRPPEYHTPDEDVYLPGRNLVLISKAGIFCAAAGISRLAIGTLAGNPFPDATPAFRESLSRAVSLGLHHPFQVVAPFESLHKNDLVERGMRREVPFELTLSCMKPFEAAGGPVHCGLCSKCRERHDAFVTAGHADATVYRDRRYVGPP